jgi:hypothetical protein
MRLLDLLCVYLAIGVACALAIARRADATRGRVVLSALLAVPLWPLWAPFALAGPARAAPPTHGAHAASARRPIATSAIASVLDQAVAAVEGSPLEPLFSRDAADRIAAEVARIEARRAALARIVGPDGAELAASSDGLRELEARGGPPRVIASARLRHDSLLRLATLRIECSQALDDLAALLEALRAQLLLARFEGTSVVDVEGIVAEVWSRLEGLAATQETAGA